MTDRRWWVRLAGAYAICFAVMAAANVGVDIFLEDSFTGLPSVPLGIAAVLATTVALSASRRSAAPLATSERTLLGLAVGILGVVCVFLVDATVGWQHGRPRALVWSLICAVATPLLAPYLARRAPPEACSKPAGPSGR